VHFDFLFTPEWLLDDIMGLIQVALQSITCLSWSVTHLLSYM